MATKIEDYSEFHKISHRNPPESFSEKKARLAIVDLLEQPFQLSRRYGIFPLAFVKETLELHFCWKCIFTSSAYLMLLMTSPILFQSSFSEEDLQKVFDVVGPTERTTNFAVNIVTQSFDAFCIVMAVWDHKRIQIFFATLMVKLKVLCVTCNELKNKKDFRQLKAPKNQFKRVMGVIIFFAIIALGNSFLYYGGKAYTSGMAWWKIIMVFILTVYWVTLNQIRMITFLMWIALIICFKVAFQCLRQITDMNKQSKMFWTRDRIPWVIRRYQELESLLKEFQSLFSFQLCNICFTTLITTVNSWFNLTKHIGQSDIEFFEISTSITLFCGLITLNVTLIVLCNVCSSMTNEVSLESFLFYKLKKT